MSGEPQVRSSVSLTSELAASVLRTRLRSTHGTSRRQLRIPLHRSRHPRRQRKLVAPHPAGFLHPTRFAALTGRPRGIPRDRSHGFGGVQRRQHRRQQRTQPARPGDSPLPFSQVRHVAGYRPAVSLRTASTESFLTGKGQSSRSPLGVNPLPSTSTKIGLWNTKGFTRACGLVP
jgi:hypothetical protein